jgi:hypothetical protein
VQYLADDDTFVVVALPLIALIPSTPTAPRATTERS